MREDMFKVIVERPRRVNSNAYKGDGRQFRNREDGPVRLGMKKGYNDWKSLNENLAPLKRYLEKQVNRPWDKVYSEIRASIDARNTVKQHVLQHLENFVGIRTRWEEDGKGGRVIVLGSRWTGNYVPLEESSRELFVHPLTGILLRNRRYASWHEYRKQERLAAEQKKLAVRRDVSARVQLHRIDGIWYEVMLDELPRGREIEEEVNGAWKTQTIFDKRWDVMRKTWVTRQSPGSNQDFYGRAELYAISKRQLNSRELQHYRLTDPHQKQKARKGAFCFWCAGKSLRRHAGNLRRCELRAEIFSCRRSVPLQCLLSHPRGRHMIVTRAVYDAVHQIHQQSTQYDPGNPAHTAALVAGVAEVNGGFIELTFKGELVLDL